VTSKEKAKDARLRRTYNISLEQQNEILAEQNGLCAICQRDFGQFQTYQDHLHKCCPRRLKRFCGKCNRGLLCYLCNKFLVGIVEKQNLPVDRLLAYIEKWEPILKARGAYEPKEAKKTRSRKAQKSFDTTMDGYRASRGVALGAMQYSDSGGGTKYAAKPSPTDFRCDVDRVIKKMIEASFMHLFVAAYVEYDSDDPIEFEMHADKIIGEGRHNLEQEMGGEFIRRRLFPARGKGGYFTAIRKWRDK
jgi:hypothetical protein